MPAGTEGGLACVVQYAGYGGGRGLVHENTLWAQAGYAHFVMDSRGQGSAGSVGVTEDSEGSGPAFAGVMTRGITDPLRYYYRRLIVDAVRAVDTARGTPFVDPARIAVAGGSQGGGLAIAAAALADGVVAAMPDVPFLCDFPRALQLATTAPYGEIVRYLAAHRDQTDQVMATLSYIDGAHLARRANVPALFSVALMDPTCPPSTVYAAYNEWAGPKQVEEYPFNGHEGGGPFQVAAQLAWLPTRMPSGPGRGQPASVGAEDRARSSRTPRSQARWSAAPRRSARPRAPSWLRLVCRSLDGIHPARRSGARDGGRDER